MKHARIVNNTAVDVRGNSPVGFFTPNIVAEFQVVPDEVEDGWILDDDTWSAPPVLQPYAPTQEEIDAETARTNTIAAAAARTKRDLLLSETDFHALTDTDMSEAMTTYRQALRDVPQQDEFPNEINWPTEPN